MIKNREHNPDPIWGITCICDKCGKEFTAVSCGVELCWPCEHPEDTGRFEPSLLEAVGGFLLEAVEKLPT